MKAGISSGAKIGVWMCWTSILLAGCAGAPAPTAASDPSVPSAASAGAIASATPARGATGDLDLAAFGPAFAGYVAAAPAGAKVELDGSSRHIVLSAHDYVSLSEAPFWEDGVAGLPGDPENKNIQRVSPTEVRYEGAAPLGSWWAIKVLVMVGSDKFSCTAGNPGTFTSAEMRDQIGKICKSIHKK